MKKLLFVINTLGQGGAETALLSLLRSPLLAGCRTDLYVMLGQGELVDELPPGVRLLNRRYCPEPVLTPRGRRQLRRTVLTDCFRRGAGFRNLAYMMRGFREMRRSGAVRKDKLLWKLIADAAPVPAETYDLAVAYLEGASTYYVADHVHAAHKAAFVHVDYGMAGYTPFLDHGCYGRMDRIFCVSGEVRRSFLSVYPDCVKKTGVFHNLVDVDGIRRKAREPGGFADGFRGVRILTVSRLVPQKRLDVSIEAMRLLKERRLKTGRERERTEPSAAAREDCGIRWYVLGEGEEREALEKQIREAGLTGEFLLSGVRRNPYPYFREADLYVHCTGFEGRSIAVEEAQILGKPVIVSDTSGNRDQVRDGVDGLLVPLEPAAVAEAVERLLALPDFAERLGRQAMKRDFSGGNLAALLEGCGAGRRDDENQS